MSRQTCDRSMCTEFAAGFVAGFFFCEKHAPADVAVTK